MKLKEVRKAGGLGRGKAARLTEVGEPMLWRYEVGKTTPTLETTIKICRGLGFDRETILAVDEFRHITEPLVEIGLIQVPAREDDKE